MNGAQLCRAKIVGRYQSLESPFVSQDVQEQVLVTVRWDSVDFVIGGHHRGYVRFLDGGFERLQPVFTDGAFGIVRGTYVGAAFGLAVNGEMLCGGHHVGFVDARAGSLIAGNRRYTQARYQVRVFAVGFFCAAPAGIARQVEHRCEALLDAAGAGFRGGSGEDFVKKAGIPS